MQMNLNAKARLLAFYVNYYEKDHFGPAHFRPFNAKQIRESAGEHLGSADGIDLFYTSGSVSTYTSTQFIIALEGDKVIGFLVLRKLRPVPMGSIIGVLEEYVGRGIGNRMQNAVLVRFGNYMSSNNLSVGATKSWAKLIKQHGGFLIFSKVKCPVRSFVQDAADGAMYPIFEFEGKHLNLKTLLEGADPGMSRLARNSVYVIH